jgi:serine/threonine protein kinase/formylglycine-generating enzyme required for sulfatase activity
MAVDPARAKSLFLAASDLANPAERAAYLDRECGGEAELRTRVEALLRANDASPLPEPGRADATGAFPPDVPAAGATTDHPGKDEQAGTVIAGKYTLVEVIGEGGMGSVWRARQTEPVKRYVAVKLIKAGMDSKQVLARFEAERQALALMDHPNIAKVLDGGLHEHRPFFVMELVKGVPITEYGDNCKLTPKERLELFVPVCQAIQHAHQKGIIHRDLKPNNVLIALYDDKPVVKVIDFGIAKATGAALTERTIDTGFGGVVGTPQYMSPEQATFNNLDIDTRSDVYALGVLLYELLTGSPPFARKELEKQGLLEILRVVREEEPPRPSTKLSTADALPTLSANRGTEPKKLAGLLRNELDWIVMKALEKDRARRYDTANAFAADVLRYLGGEAVQAHPPSAAYRIKKFVRRNKGQVISVSLIVLTLVMGTAVSYLKYRDAEQQKSVALREAEKAEKAREFLASIFRKAETDAKGGNVTVRQLLEEAEARIPAEFADQPDLRAELMTTIGDVKRGIARRTPQAMLLDVRGAVQLQSAAGVTKGAVPQALVNLDDRLTLGPDGHVQLVFLSDFHKERIKPGRAVTIDSRGCAPAEAVQDRDSSVLMTFARLPKGTFYMGGYGPRKGVKTEIKEDFEIAVHDVTQGQWQEVMGNNPSYFSRQGNGRNYVLDISDEELKLFPVESVSWDDAQEFIQKLNEKELGRGYWYRLPTDAEWEYACRGGATSEEECSYHFYLAKPSNDLSSEQANFNGTMPFGNSPVGKWLQRTSRVGAYPSNKLGLCDMHGNVAQWCADLEDPANLVNPEGTARVTRGGLWYGDGEYCMATGRGRAAPSQRASSHGFRLARVPVRPQ